MARRIVFGISAWVYLATIAITLAAIIIPEWISWDAYPESVRQVKSLTQDASAPSIDIIYPDTAAFRGPANHVHYSYGLHARCDSISQSCTPFPAYDDCQGLNRKFCSLWRTTGFLMSIAVVFELAGIVGYAIVLIGGKQKRERGWKMMVGIIIVCAAAQAIAMAIVLEVHEEDQHFFAGWYLGKSFVLATVSWSLQAVIAVSIAASAFLLPEEGGYELIPDRARTD